MSTMKLFDLFGKAKAAKPKPQFDPVNTDTPFCVIGDIHGRLDLLERLVTALPSDIPILSVGDMVDRGEQSAQVLRYVFDHPRMSAIMGNHEAMMLNFLADPETHGRRWLRNGGLQTLASFGIAGATETSDGETLIRARDSLYQEIGEEIVAWITDLEYTFMSGNVVVAHAGADPNTDLSEQSPDTFIWGHPDFRRTPRHDGIWVVHGHTIVDDPKVADGRISIDTGAYATGVLTAVVFHEDTPEFVTT